MTERFSVRTRPIVEGHPFVVYDAEDDSIGEGGYPTHAGAQWAVDELNSFEEFKKTPEGQAWLRREIDSPVSD